MAVRDSGRQLRSQFGSKAHLAQDDYEVRGLASAVGTLFFYVILVSPSLGVAFVGAARWTPPSIAQRHQFDYTFGCPELQSVSSAATR